MSAPFAPTADSATIGTTEYFLVSDSTIATYQTSNVKARLTLDLVNMVAGDQFRIRAYDKVNAGTATVVYEAFVEGAAPGLWHSTELWLDEGWEWSLKKIAGTDRIIAWSRKEDTGDTNVLTWGSAAGAVNALVSGRVDASVGAMAANVITAAATAADFGTEIGTAVLAATIHAGWSVARALRVIGGATAGLVTETATAFTARFLDDSGDAVTGTVDTTGNRTLITHGA